MRGPGAGVGAGVGVGVWVGVGGNVGADVGAGAGAGVGAGVGAAAAEPDPPPPPQAVRLSGPKAASPRPLAHSERRFNENFGLLFDIKFLKKICQVGVGLLRLNPGNLRIMCEVFSITGLFLALNRYG